MELQTLDLSIVGSNPICDTVLRALFLFLEYNKLKAVESSGEALSLLPTGSEQHEVLPFGSI